MKRKLRVFLAALILGLLASMMTAGSAQAAGKTGLVVKGSAKYYYKKGKVQKKVFKKLKDKDGKRYWFYFGKDGKAYRSKKAVPAVKKVGKYKYAFDKKGHIVTGAWYFYDEETYTGEFMVFKTGKNYGRQDKAATRKLNAVLKKLMSSTSSTTVKLEEFTKLLLAAGNKKEAVFLDQLGCNPVDYAREGYAVYNHVVFCIGEGHDGVIYVNEVQKYQKPSAVKKLMAAQLAF